MNPCAGAQVDTIAMAVPGSLAMGEPGEIGRSRNLAEIARLIDSSSDLATVFNRIVVALGKRALKFVWGSWG